jgi:hypothetical protein
MKKQRILALFIAALFLLSGCAAPKEGPTATPEWTGTVLSEVAPEKAYAIGGVRLTLHKITSVQPAASNNTYEIRLEYTVDWEDATDVYDSDQAYDTFTTGYYELYGKGENPLDTKTADANFLTPHYDEPGSTALGKQMRLFASYVFSLEEWEPPQLLRIFYDIEGKYHKLDIDLTDLEWGSHIQEENK